jgi:hypothetical protein
MRSLLVALTAAFSLLWLVPAASAGGPTMVLGTADDIVRAPDLVGTKAEMTMLRLAGFRAVRISSIWRPGLSAPTAGELGVLRNVEGAAQLSGIRVYVQVYAAGSRTTPLTSSDQTDFASYAAALVRALPLVDDVIIGNEPNLNRFWLPQFGANGEDVAAPAYLSLLALSYDAIKAADPSVRVWGGALAPRGIDRPNTGRDTHSPTAFITDLGAAYRASGRQARIMDGLAIHPYGENSSTPPTFAHPNSTSIGIADYAKLVGLLGKAFDGTPQPGSTLPILYAEYGVESVIPPGKAQLYSGTEPSTTRPVDETTQASFYEQALELAFCQPTVVGFLVFHAEDETALPSWQSGVFYADGTPKASQLLVRDALDRARTGSIARCPGLELPVTATTLRYPTRAEVRRSGIRVRLRCSLDCIYSVRLRKLSTGSTTRAKRGYARAGRLTIADLGLGRVAPGNYYFTVSLIHPVNPAAEPTLVQSKPLKLP